MSRKLTISSERRSRSLKGRPAAYLILAFVGLRSRYQHWTPCVDVLGKLTRNLSQTDMQLTCKPFKSFQKLRQAETLFKPNLVGQQVSNALEIGRCSKDVVHQTWAKMRSNPDRPEYEESLFSGPGDLCRAGP